MATAENRDLQDSLDQARADFDDMVTVAFVGTRHAGKTVHCALLKDAAAKHLMRHTRNQYVGVATAGSGRINKIMDALYDGRFPKKTAQGEATPLTVEITTARNGGDLALIFHDMAGEEYDELLTREMPIKERIQVIVDTPKIDGKSYGLMSHLIFAKIYVVVIDCSDIKRWGSLQAYVKDAIRSIYEIKKYIHGLYNNKIAADIAIVFSKCDTLSDDKKADELATELPEIQGVIKKYVGGDVEFFRSRLETKKLNKGEIKEARVERLNESLAEAEKKVSACQSDLDRATNRLESEKVALDAATLGFDTAKASGNAERIKSCQAAHDKARLQYEESDRKRSNLADMLESARAAVEEIRSKDQAGGGGGDRGANQRGPVKPLSYNTDEYLEMITWMIKKANRSMGR